MQPLLLVFEDLHWIDAETQALLDSLVESLPTARLLLLVNYRPEYQHGWGSKTYYTQLRLDPLPPASADELLAGAARGRPQPGAAQAAPDRAHARAIPSSWRRACAPWWRPGCWSGERGAYRLAQAAADASRCRPRCRRCWRRASTGCRRRRSACSRPPRSLARRCPSPLLQAIAELPEEALHRGLAHLQAAEFLYETRLFPELGVHLQARPDPRGGLRQPPAGAAARAARPHRRGPRDAVAATGWPSRSNAWPTMPCGARCGTKAVAYLRQAGDKAAARSAHREAVGHLSRRCSLSSTCPMRRAASSKSWPCRPRSARR